MALEIPINRLVCSCLGWLLAAFYLKIRDVFVWLSSECRKLLRLS